MGQVGSASPPHPPSGGFLLPFQGNLAKPSVPEAPRVHGDGQSATGGWLSRRQSKVPEQKQEKAGKKDNNHTKEVWRKGGRELAAPQSILLPMHHASMRDVSPPPHTLVDGAPIPAESWPELWLGGGEDGLVGGQTQPQQPPSLTPPKLGAGGSLCAGQGHPGLSIKGPFAAVGCQHRAPKQPRKIPPPMVPAARGGVSRRGWERSPASPPLGCGDGKRQVGVAALRLCRQRKRSPGQGVPGGRGLGGDGGGDPAAKGCGSFCKAASQKHSGFELRRGWGAQDHPCPARRGRWDRAGGTGPVAELVSLGRQGTALGWWAAWLTTCKPPAPPASPA